MSPRFLRASLASEAPAERTLSRVLAKSVFSSGKQCVGHPPFFPPFLPPRISAPPTYAPALCGDMVIREKRPSPSAAEATVPGVPGGPRRGLPLGHTLPASPLLFLVAQVAAAARLLMVALRVLGLRPAQDRCVAGAARHVRHYHGAPLWVQTLLALGCWAPHSFQGAVELQQGSSCPAARRPRKARSAQGTQGARRWGGAQAARATFLCGGVTVGPASLRTPAGDVGPQTLLPSPGVLPQGALWLGPR